MGDKATRKAIASPFLANVQEESVPSSRPMHPDNSGMAQHIDIATRREYGCCSLPLTFRMEHSGGDAATIATAAVATALAGLPASSARKSVVQVHVSTDGGVDGVDAAAVAR